MPAGLCPPKSPPSSDAEGGTVFGGQRPAGGATGSAIGGAIGGAIGDTTGDVTADATGNITGIGSARGKQVTCCKLRTNLGAEEERVNLEAGGQAMLQLAAAFHHKQTFLPAQAGFLLERQQVLDLRVLGRCNTLNHSLRPSIGIRGPL